MKGFTKEECDQWRQAHGYGSESFDPRWPSEQPKPKAFRFVKLSIPSDSGRRVALARQLMSHVQDDSELLLQITDWSVWASGQHHPLFTRFRQALGETRHLIEAPGQCFSAAERDDALSTLVVSALFLWDCYAYCAGGGLVIFLSHDEYGWIATKDKDTYSAAEENLKRWDILIEDD